MLPIRYLSYLAPAFFCTIAKHCKKCNPSCSIPLQRELIITNLIRASLEIHSTLGNQRRSNPIHPRFVILSIRYHLPA
jgi:hypothetical protein